MKIDFNLARKLFSYDWFLVAVVSKTINFISLYKKKLNTSCS